MVLKSLSLLCKTENIVSQKALFTKSRFLDRLRLVVVGGPGGTGFPKINGVGGPGGSVYIKVSPKATLRQLLSKYPDGHVKAGGGGNSARIQLLGLPGKDVTVEVPPGVTVVGPKQNVLADLVETDQTVLVAKGGKGGDSRNHFNGSPGSRDQITLFLKLIADIGFVGFPNAGKSTLLRALSHARPRVANYPFTTIKPNIGMMEYSDHRQIACADLPGLIEGAHKNVGLGHSFLRHVERTSLLLFIVDINGFRLNPQSAERDAFETIMSLNKEVEFYRKDLLLKPAVLVINKMDTDGAQDKLAELREKLESQTSHENLGDDIRPETRIEFKQTVPIAAKENQNVEFLKLSLREHLDELFEEKLSKEEDSTEMDAPTELTRQLM